MWILGEKISLFVNIHFSHYEEDILETIRQLQSWSRQLYHIISHGKREKDASLAKEAPRAKKALEVFIHKVKAMLKKNRCMTAMCKWAAIYHFCGAIICGMNYQDLTFQLFVHTCCTHHNRDQNFEGKRH